jgi:hypothetical protein
LLSEEWGAPHTDITPRRVYEVSPDTRAESVDMVRVVDDSGEGCLYSASFFILIMLLHEAEEIFDSL